MAVKGTALVKARERYKRLIKTFPDRAEFYQQKITETEDSIRTLGVCRRCGRPLSDEVARARGYGNECLRRAEEESANRQESLAE